MPTGSLQLATSSSSDEGPSSSDSESEQKYSNDYTENKKPTLAIRKDGMAVCELCGNVGVKHAFYSKSKRYCSLACSRASATSITTNTTVPAKSFTCQVKLSHKRPIMVAPPLKKKHCSGFPFQRKRKHDVAGSFDWKTYFSKPDFAAAPVSCFKHVALSDVWDNITIGMKVEVENTDCENLTKLFPSFYWIASVVKISGFYAMLRYEGFEHDGSKDFWVNLCVDAVHPVGWCASQGKPLIPPKSIEHKYVDWKDFLVKRLTGSRTFPANFHQKVEESFLSRIRPEMRLEVVDKNRISAVRVARVAEVVGGRLHLSYESSEEDDFWCHERSPLIHPVGWAQVVGHDLRASPEYARESLQKTLLKNFDQNDASWDFFQPVKSGPNELRFKEGMKLEAIDPLNLSTICVATVTRVLRSNYLMIGIDGMMAANGSDWFCYHATSPCIFPVGFCELNNIELTPPRGHKGEFNWFEYLRDTNSAAAPVSLFKKDIPNHGFRPGVCVEAVDLMEPRLICVGSISQVVGRLLRLHFDGWDSNYDQWCDCESPDLFPVGWCQAVGYKLESPRLQDGSGNKKKKKNPSYRGQRKKKKRTLGLYGHKKILKHGSSENIESLRSKSDDSVSSSSESGIAPRSPLTTQIAVTNGTAKLHSDGGPALAAVHTGVSPHHWGVLDVAQFLRINECGAYCQLFSQKKINGNKFLSLTKDELLALTGMKVGPSLKIFDLIQQLKTLNST